MSLRKCCDGEGLLLTKGRYSSHSEVERRGDTRPLSIYRKDIYLHLSHKRECGNLKSYDITIANTSTTVTGDIDGILKLYLKNLKCQSEMIY